MQRSGVDDHQLSQRDGIIAIGPSRVPVASVGWPIRVACFLACGTSGAALLVKVYGLASMRFATLAVALPCALWLVAVGVWSRHSRRTELASMLGLGALGGFIGTLAYDLARVPFHLAGQRIFAPIAAYGIWIADAPESSRATDVVGWLYHFSNGIAFGAMYALVLPRRGWGWAVAWGLVLETIALVSPFARIFSISGNYAAISIAYAGHVAYGIPLGMLVQRWDETMSFLAKLSPAFVWSVLAVVAGAIVWPLVDPSLVQRDRRAIPGAFHVEGARDRLNPDWLRVTRGADIRVINPGSDSVWLRAVERDIHVSAGDSVVIPFAAAGVYQLFLETGRRSRSSFVIVEPVEAVK